MRKYIVLLIGFVFNMNCFGQEMPKIIPPSPEAANAFKFTEVPVSLHTGVPNISIPLFEIESGGVIVPISISYHARGIKVAEMASRVGLGWTLNAGGMISRQIRDKADDGFFGYLQPYNAAYTYKDINGNVDFFSSITKREFIWQNYSDNYDFIPDQYFFNTGTGLNGKFIYDYKDGKILPQNYSNVKVHSNRRMTDGKGNEYFFGDDGVTDMDQIQNNYLLSVGGYSVSNHVGDYDVNTWHLSKIKTQTGSEIEFSYDYNEQAQFYRRSYDKLDESTGQYKSNASSIVSYQKRIKEITFDKGKVVFEYQDGREDLEGGSYLKQVTLLDRDSIVIKRKVFEYEYTNSSDIDNNSNVNHYLKSMDSYSSKRMFLKSVKTVAANNVSMPPHTFEYNTNKLPSRHSNSQDIWGYYNGKNNGQFLQDSYAQIDARSVDTIKTGAGLLKKIIFPEGGSASFYYEQNRVYNHFPKSIVFYNNPNPITKKGVIVASLDFNPTIMDSITNQPVYSVSSNVYRRTFIVSDAVRGLNMSYKISGSACGNGALPNCKFTVTIRNQSNYILRTLSPTPTNQYSSTSVLSPGTYILEVKPTNPNHSPGMDNPDENFIVYVEWIEDVVGPNEPVYAGGKRIKKIEYRDANDNLGLTKTYNYNDPSTGKSSGILLGLSNFQGIKSTVVNQSGALFTLFHGSGNVPGSPLSTFQENSIGYGVVTEYIGEGVNTIGKTVHRFTMTPDTGLYYEFPYHAPTDNEWLRGKELSIIHYKKNDNGSFTQIKKIENEYLYGGYLDPTENKPTPAVFQPIPIRKSFVENLNTSSLEHFKDSKMFRLPLAHIYIENDIYTTATSLKYKVYHLTGGTVDLWKTKVTDYFDGGNEMVTTTDYNYRYDNHYNTSFTTQSVSNGDPIITRYYYPTDSEMSSKPVVSKLIEKNMKDILLETRVSRGLLNNLSAQETVYKDWDLNLVDSTYLLLPEIIKTSKGTATLEERIKYNVVDATNGNPLEVQQKDGMKICYIWGYNKNQPVAKIENATYTQVEPYVANIQTLSNGNNEQDLITALNNLRTVLPNAMITTLTYKPLVGVSTITDPKGQITTYEYDSFGRLQRVKDHLGNILSENEYHYRTQN